MKKHRILNGYKIVFLPIHPKAMTSKNWNGYVYEHICVAEEMLGRSLRTEEVVHHLDQNRSNNRMSNLLVLEGSQHAKLHNWMRNGAPGLQLSNMTIVQSGAVYCKTCSKILHSKQNKYCSKKCSALSPERHKTNRPGAEKLKKDLKTNSWASLGRKYGVSDNAVRKWAISYGLINKP